MRIGYGYDVHQFADGRDLILGGVEIPYQKGLLGHSDADVLLHAVMDALLGAAALGDQPVAVGFGLVPFRAAGCQQQRGACKKEEGSVSHING